VAVSAASSVPGIPGLGPVAGAGRSALAPGDLIGTGAAGPEAAGGSQTDSAPSPVLPSASGAQAFVNEQVNAGVFSALPSAQYVAAAYQAASVQLSTTAAPDIQLPGLPPRLASGRLVDLSV